MKTYPELYSRSNTGAVLIWRMEQEAEKYRSISGTQDGLKTTSEWTIAISKNIGKKNETNAGKQAELEIKAKYKKQLKSGDYHENISDIDAPNFFQVMLAKNYKDYEKDIDWKRGVGIQIKYNGGRILATKDGLFSRKGEKYKCIPHIENALIPFFKENPEAILDGEGFNFELRERLNEIMELLRKTVHISEEDLEKSRSLIKFYIYDGFNIPIQKHGQPIFMQDGYLLRKKAIDNIFSQDKYKDVIGKVPTWIVHSENELEKLYESFLAERHEGAIIRILDKPYEMKRSKYLLKYKPVDDSEFKIIAVHDGVGKFANRLATVRCERIDSGVYMDGANTFDATFKGEKEEAVEAWKNKDNLINKIVTIYYNGVTGYGKPNFARFDWKNYNKGN